MEKFKGDELENQVIEATDLLFNNQGAALDAFFEDAYWSQIMGALLHDNSFIQFRSVISRETFIKSFKEIFEAWSFAGTFESYIYVFKKVLGETSDIQFTVPNPAHLQIAITASQLELYNFIADVGEPEPFNIVTENGDRIVFSSLFGVGGEQDIKNVFFSMTPNGIFVEVEVTILEEEEFLQWRMKTSLLRNSR